VSRRFPCPSLGREVELTDEREAHIYSRYPELSGILVGCIADALSDPDQIRQSSRVPASHLFIRWFETILGGKHVAVVVVTDRDPVRDWIVTTYVARRLSVGA
jgi:hypothetical protein